MFCNFCGSKVPDDAIYCSKCGKSLEGQFEHQSIEEGKKHRNTRFFGNFKIISLIVGIALVGGVAFYQSSQPDSISPKDKMVVEKPSNPPNDPTNKIPNTAVPKKEVTLSDASRPDGKYDSSKITQVAAAYKCERFLLDLWGTGELLNVEFGNDGTENVYLKIKHRSKILKEYNFKGMGRCYIAYLRDRKLPDIIITIAQGAHPALVDFAIVGGTQNGEIRVLADKTIFEKKFSPRGNHSLELKGEVLLIKYNEITYDPNKGMAGSPRIPHTDSMLWNKASKEFELFLDSDLSTRGEKK